MPFGINASVTSRIASTIAQAEGSAPGMQPPKRRPGVTVGPATSAWDDYVVRRDRSPEAQELRGYAKSRQAYDYDTCRPEVELYDAPCSEHVLAVVEFQAWRWDLALYWLKVHARNKPATDDVEGWWAWVATAEAFSREMVDATNVAISPGVQLKQGAAASRLRAFVADIERQTGGPVFFRSGDLRKRAKACDPAINVMGWHKQQPELTGTAAWLPKHGCQPGGCSWNDPTCRRGDNHRGTWGTLAGFPVFRRWAELYVAMLADVRGFTDVITRGMETWFASLQWFVDRGILDVSPEDWAKMNATVAKARSAATANQASAAAASFASLAGSINVIAGAALLVYSVVLFGVGLLLKKYGAVGGHQCPTAPFRRSLLSRGCDTSRVVGNTGLVKTLENMDALTPDFTLVPEEYRTPPAPDPAPQILVATPPLPPRREPVDSGGLPALPLAIGAAVVGGIILWKARGA